MNIFDPHISGSLSVSASAHIEGDLTVLGTIRGNAEITGEVENAVSASHAASYLLTSSFEGVSGSFAITGSNNFKGNQTISGSLLPEGTLVHDLGSDSQRWKDIYLAGNTIDIGGTKISKNSDGNIQLHDSGNTLKKLIASEIELGHGANKKVLKVSNGRLKLMATNDSDEELAQLSGSFSGSFSGDGSGLVNVPASGVTGLSLDTISSGSNSLVMGRDVLVSNVSILPNITDKIDLGSPDKQWRDLFLSSGSLYINGQQVISTTGNELRITTDEGESIKIIETESDTVTLQTEDGDITLTSSGDGNIELDAPVQIGAGNKILSSDGNSIQFANGLSITGSVRLTGTVDGVDISNLKVLFNDYTSSNDTTNTNQSSRLDQIESFTSSIDDTYATDGDVTTLRGDLNTYTSSNDVTNQTQNGRLDSIETESGSIRGTFNTFTSSIDGTIKTKLNTENVLSGSIQVDITQTTNYNLVDGRLDSVENFTSSVDGEIRNDFNTYTSSNNTDISTLKTHKRTVEDGLEFTGSNVTVKGNLLVKGTETRVNSTTVDVDDNIISLNGTGASDAGIEVRDVTSPGILSGSLLWDGVENHWKGGTKGNEERLLNNTDLTNIDDRLDLIEMVTSSHDGRLDSIETVTSSFDGRLDSIETVTSSFDGRLDSIETVTSSFDGRLDSIETTTSSLDGRVDSLETTSGSHDSRLDSLESNSGSYLTTYNDEYTTGATFNTGNGVITYKRNDGDTFSVDIDGRYLTSFTETDPVFTASPSAGIKETDISNWDTAYGWGDHASAGYLPLSGGSGIGQAMTGNLHIQNPGPKIYLKDTTDDDDQAIYFQNNGGTTEYIISTQDFTSGGLADGMFIGSVSSDELGLVTNNTTALYIDTSQNSTFSGHIIPKTDATQDLGTTNSLDFRTLYVRNIDIFNQRVNISSTGTMATFSDHTSVGDGIQFNHLGTEILRLGNGSGTTATFAGTISASGYNDSNWNTAYGWGDHADGGYIKSYTETDTLESVTDRGATTSNDISVGKLTSSHGYFNSKIATSPSGDDLNISGYGMLGNRDGNPIYVHNFGNGGIRLGVNTTLGDGNNGVHITDTLSTFYTNLSVTGTLTASGYNDSNWNTAYGWGDHSQVGYIVAYNDEYTTGATFNTNDGKITFTRNDGDTYSVDLDGRFLDTRAQVHSELYSTGGDANDYTEFGIYRNYASNGPIGSHNTILHVSQTDGNYGFQLGGSTVANGDGLYFRNFAGNDTITGSTWLQIATRDWVGDQNYVTTSGYNNTNWDTAYGWGNHASAGYLTSFTEIDTLDSVTDRGSSTSNAITVGELKTTKVSTSTDDNLYLYPTGNGHLYLGDSGNGMNMYHYSQQNNGKYTTFTHNGSYYRISPTATSGLEITSNTRIVGTLTASGYNDSNWNTAYGWGDHSTEGYLTSYNDEYTTGATFNGGNGIITFTRNDGDTYTVDISTTLVDVTVTGGTYNDSTQTLTLTKSDGDSVDIAGFAIESVKFTTGATFNTSNGIVTYTNNDSTTYTVDLDGRYLTSYTETDPVFMASPSAGITDTNISNWNTAYGWGDHSTEGYLTSSSTQSKYLRSDTDDTTTGALTIGDGSNQARLKLKKSDNNTADHIEFYNGTTRVGEIGASDNTWLRLNNLTNKNIYTPRYIRADAGFFVDGTSKGINGSGNFIGGTITGASDANVGNWNTAYGWGNHASAGYIKSYVNTNEFVTGATFNTGNGIITFRRNNGGDTFTVDIDGKYSDVSHKYHSFSNGNEYYDGYGQNNFLRLFTENSVHDNFRFRSYSDVEYYDGSNWVTWNQNLDTLFDGLETTGFNLSHTHSKFRFVIQRSSGWPTTANFVIQSSWSDIGSTTGSVILETYDGSQYNVKDSWTYGSYQRGYNLHTTTQAHDGKGQMRVTIDLNWSDNSHDYTPLRRILMLSNFSGNQYDMKPFTWEYNQDVTFARHIKVSGGDSTQWNTAYGWGNHASAGYIKSYTETDTLDSVTDRGATTSNVITVGGVNLNDSNSIIEEASGNAFRFKTSTGYIDIGSKNSGWIHFEGNRPYYFGTSYSAFDGDVRPYTNNVRNLGSTTHRWAGIYANGGDSSQWNTAYGWGDHSQAGYLTSLPSHNHDGRYLLIGGKSADSEKLDGLNSTQFLRSDTSDTFTGDVLGFPSLSLGIANNNSDNGYDTYFRGSSSHFVLGLKAGNTLYLNYGNATGSMRTYGSWLHGDTQILSNGRVLTNVTNTNWDTAYGWGDHSQAGYLTSSSTQSKYLRSDTSDTHTATLTVDGQFIFNSSLNSSYREGIRLNSSTTGWGGAVFGGVRNSISGITDAWWVARNPSKDFVISFGTSSKSGGLHLPHNSSALSYKNNRIWNESDFTSTNINNWNTAYGWGNHASAGYIKSYVNTNEFVTGATFNTGNGVVTFKRNNGGDTFNVDLDGRYAIAAHNHKFLLGSTANEGGGGLQNWNSQESTLNLNPTTDWYTSLRIGHGDPVAYYSNTLAIQMTGGDSGRMYIRTVANGTKQTWKKYWHDGDFTSTNINNWNTAYGWGDHSTAGYTGDQDLSSYATKTYVGTQISNLVDSAPGTLDTLNELARALGDDPNFATTITNSIATKLPLAGGTLTGDLTIDNNTPRIDFKADQSGGNVGGRIELNENGNLWVNAQGGKDLWLNWYSPTSASSKADLQVGDGNQGSSILTVQGTSRRVGINKTSPTQALDVSGNIIASGVLYSSGGNSGNWNTAYGWGNHASAGYLTSLPSHNHDGRYLLIGGKAADSNKLDGIDSSKFFRDNGWNNYPGMDADNQPDQSVDFSYNNNAPHSGPLIRMGASEYSVQFSATYNDASGKLSFRSYNNDSAKTWNPWRQIFHSGVFTNNSGNWNTAYGWGDHASAGYLTSLPSHNHDGRYLLIGGKAADSDKLDGLDSSRFLHTSSSVFTGDWDTLTDTDYEIQLREVQNISNGSHSNYPTGVYTYGSVLGWQLGNSTFKLYTSHTGDLVFQSGWNNDRYSGWRTIYHSGNFNPSDYLTTSGKAADSDKLDGLDLHTGRNNEANKVVRTDVNGYIQAGWINTTSGNNNTTAINRIYASQDGYIRYYTPANFISVLGLVTTTGYNNSNWDTAYGWGDHASGGYLTSYSETDTLSDVIGRGNTTTGSISFTGTGANTGIKFNSTIVANDGFGIRVNGTSNAGELEFYSTDDDTEPFVFRHYTSGQDGTGSSVEWFRIGAGGNISTPGTVTASGGNSGNWNTAYGWGDHASAGYLTSLPSHNHDGRYLLIGGKAVDSDKLDGIDSGTFMRRDTNVTLASGSKFTFHSGGGGTTFSNNHYSMGVDIANGGWSSPNYSDLIIGYHTGIRIGAAYGGTRFYNNSPTTDTNNNGNGNGNEGLIMTVGGNAGSNSIIVQGDVTASGGNSTQWNQAYGWGNHNSPGYARLAASNSFTNSYNEFGNGTGSVSNDGSWNARVNVAGSSHARLDVKSVSDGIITTMYSHTGNNRGKIGTMSNHALGLLVNGTERATLHSTGRLEVSGPIDAVKINLTGEVNINNSTANKINFNDSSAYWLSTANNWGLYWNTSSNSLGFHGSGTERGSIDLDNGNLQMDGTGRFGSYIATNTGQTRSKIRLWDTDTNYAIGFKSGYDFGHLGNSSGTGGEYAISFMQNNNSSRGFWWGHADHSDDQGAMALTADGRLNVAKSVSIGEGENKINPSGVPLYVEGTTAGATVFEIQGTQGQLFSITDDLTGDLFTVSDISGIPILSVNSLGVVTVDDTLLVTGDVIAYHASDKRLKDNIKPIENAIDKVKMIGGYEFDWNKLSKNEGHDVGVIAQEIEEVLPELVGTRGDGYKGVKYEKLTSLLIEAIKDQQIQIDELKSKLEK